MSKPRPLLFGHNPTSQNRPTEPVNPADEELERMRADAMRAEMRRYYRAEARELFRQQLRDTATQAGHPDPFADSETTTHKPSVLGATVRVALSIPGLIVMCLCYAIVAFLFCALVYGIFWGQYK